MCNFSIITIFRFTRFTKILLRLTRVGLMVTLNLKHQININEWVTRLKVQLTADKLSTCWVS